MKKLVTMSLVAAAALTVAACDPKPADTGANTIELSNDETAIDANEVGGVDNVVVANDASVDANGSVDATTNSN